MVHHAHPLGMAIDYQNSREVQRSAPVVYLRPTLLVEIQPVIRPQLLLRHLEHRTTIHACKILATQKRNFTKFGKRNRALLRSLAMNARCSAIPGSGGLLKRVSVQLAGMSASNFFEPSLSIHSRYSL